MPGQDGKAGIKVKIICASLLAQHFAGGTRALKPYPN